MKQTKLTKFEKVWLSLSMSVMILLIVFQLAVQGHA